MLIGCLYLSGCAQYEKVCDDGETWMKQNKISGNGGMPTKTFAF